MKKNRVILTCRYCGSTFSRCVSQAGNYCSDDCHYKGRTKPVAERFWSKVDMPSDPLKCWEWQASCYPDGYGQFKTHSNGRAKNNRATRIAYELTNGPISDNLLVLHRCDNPLCVRPTHLFLGTNAENMKDMVAKGREASGLKNGAYTKPETTRKGELNGRAKLTWEDVRCIRARYAAGEALSPQLSREYGVSEPSICNILRGANWKEAPSE